MIKSIVFDCDGTLVNTSFMIKVYHDTFTSMFTNEKFSKVEDFIPAYFLTNKGAIKYFEIPEDQQEKFENQLRINFDKAAINLTLYDGIEELLKELIFKKIKLGVNTSRTEEGWDLMRDIIQAQYHRKFEIVITNEKVKHHKPHPESILLYQKEAQLEKDEILFIGDSPFDYECAYQAGVKFGVAGWGVQQQFDWGTSIYFETPQDVLKYLEEETV
ncbi:HAD-IA family hydrolase [Anaerorhabdus sp.]|uniref:HAD family hydrolase n=1 Tax=Anaerorhabdus sp. TaxID=1872524 RepID=UPI002B1EA82D|nr:HAD-IA family hydrolase [Anaerorhabdus sp.]MEA4874469.1 HAD-IA family hydrolase [Anaerorhabdus sp.]